MSRYFLLAGLLFALLAGCKKNGNPAGGVTNFDSQYLTCAIDGVNTSFNINLQATRKTTITPTYPYTQVAIEGFTSQTGNGLPGLGLGWNNTSPNATFGTGPWIDTSSKYFIFADYVIDSVRGWEAGTGVWQASLGSGGNITNDLEIIVTYMDSTGVKGTFTGAFFASGVVTASKKVISNGGFSVRWK